MDARSGEQKMFIILQTVGGMEIEHLWTLSTVQCHDKRLREQYIKGPSVEGKVKNSHELTMQLMANFDSRNP